MYQILVYFKIHLNVHQKKTVGSYGVVKIGILGSCFIDVFLKGSIAL